MSGRLWMLSRKHPPSVGGMQQLSWHLVRGVSAVRPVTAITWGGGSWGLPLFFAWAQLRLALGLAFNRIAVLHLGDPALAALAWLPRLAGVPVFATVHGLDITHRARWYQCYLDRFFWGRMRAYACISRHVQSLVLARGVDAAIAPVIPVGIDIADFPERALAGPGQRGLELLCLGRLVDRKGVAWLLEAVAPAWLARHPQARLRIAGDGPARARIEALAGNAALRGQVQVLGAVDEAAKRDLLANADLLLMPNLAIAGDAEGFGLVCLEAGASGAWVLASDIEGLRDAVVVGENGDHLPSGDAHAWSEALDLLCADPVALRARGASARDAVAARFGWNAIIAQYAALTDALANGSPAHGR